MGRSCLPVGVGGWPGKVLYLTIYICSVKLLYALIFPASPFLEIVELQVQRFVEKSSDSIIPINSS